LVFKGSPVSAATTSKLTAWAAAATALRVKHAIIASIFFRECICGEIIIEFIRLTIWELEQFLLYIIFFAL
jgi:hypothetical protein